MEHSALMHIISLTTDATIGVFLQAEKVHELNEEIGKLLAKAEQLGAEGNVEESQKVMQEVERVRTKKREAEVSAISPFLIMHVNIAGLALLL